MPVGIGQFAFDNAAVRGLNHAGKGVVDWGHQDNAITWFGEGIHA